MSSMDFLAPCPNCRTEFGRSLGGRLFITVSAHLTPSPWHATQGDWVRHVGCSDYYGSFRTTTLAFGKGSRAKYIAPLLVSIDFYTSTTDIPTFSDALARKPVDGICGDRVTSSHGAFPVRAGTGGRGRTVGREPEPALVRARRGLVLPRCGWSRFVAQ